jgi:hypothetical protein
VDQQRARAQPRDRRHVVAHEQHRPPVARDVAHLAEALLLERRVSDREHLVEDEDVRLEVRSDGEREAQVHPAGVALDRRVDEAAHPGELDDLVEAPVDVRAVHPEDRARSGTRCRGR